MNQLTKTPVVITLDGSVAGDREVLGGKAYSVNRMRALGLPVPPAFALPTHVCGIYHDNGGELPEDIWADVVQAIAALEADTGRTFGQGPSPLLVSVRSGAAQSMPGMMDTVLNLGLTPALVEVLAAESNDPDWASDTWTRFQASYADIVLGGQAGPPPADPWEQLRAAIGAVFDSWTNERVRAYRERHQLGTGGGTAVTVQAMVFGNRDAESGTGVLFSRDPSTGEPIMYGEWLATAQGEDVVSGEATPESLTGLQGRFPQVHQQLEEVANTLETELRDMVDIEFTIESGRLYMLQCRTAKRSARAAVRLAVDYAHEGLITPAEALERITAEHVATLANTTGVGAEHTAEVTGLGASPGVATGRVARDFDEVLDLTGQGHAVILVRTFTAPDDVPAMFQSAGVVTEVGGATSHAALVCREIGLPCIVGAGEGVVERLTDQTITIDGASGQVFLGDATGGTSPLEDPAVRALLALAGQEGATEHPIHQLAGDHA